MNDISMANVAAAAFIQIEGGETLYLSQNKL